MVQVIPEDVGFGLVESYRVGFARIVAMDEHLAYLDISRERIIIHLDDAVVAASLVVSHIDAAVLVDMAEARLLHNDTCRVEKSHLMSILEFRRIRDFVALLRRTEEEGGKHGDEREKTFYHK